MDIKLRGAGFAAALFLMSTAAHGQALDLALCIDSSGSISAANFNLQLEGTAQAVQSAVPTDGSVRLTVLQFGSAITVEVPPTVVTANRKAAIVATIRRIAKGGGGTNMSGCIDGAVQAIIGAGSPSQRQVIDISTDGSPNNRTATSTAATNARTAGIDALNALLVGSGTNKPFMDSIVFPRPAGGNAGFTESVPNFGAYATAIRRKISIEVTGDDGDVYFGVGNISDLNGNGSMEIAALTVNRTGKPLVVIKDSRTGRSIKNMSFLNSSYRPIALSAEKNKITVLAEHKRTGKIVSQSRNPVNGSLVDSRSTVVFPKF